MANEKNMSSDPSVLGVSVPLSTTKLKAAEIAAAWRECAESLFKVAKSKLMPEKMAAAASPSASSQPQAQVARA